MKTLGASKTYYFMENEHGDITFATNYNVLDSGGGMSGGKIFVNLPPGILVAIRNFVDKDVIPEIKIKEKID